LVGRANEHARSDARAAGFVEGRGSALALTGGRGISKSARLSAARGRGGDTFRLLAVTGADDEADLGGST
jgi:hypothetical protein